MNTRGAPENAVPSLFRRPRWNPAGILRSRKLGTRQPGVVPSFLPLPTLALANHSGEVLSGSGSGPRGQPHLCTQPSSAYGSPRMAVGKGGHRWACWPQRRGPGAQGHTAGPRCLSSAPGLEHLGGARRASWAPLHGTWALWELGRESQLSREHSVTLDRSLPWLHLSFPLGDGPGEAT